MGRARFIEREEVIAAGGYPGSYNTGDEITICRWKVADGKVFHAGANAADDDRVLTSGGLRHIAPRAGSHRG